MWYYGGLSGKGLEWVNSFILCRFKKQIGNFKYKNTN